MKRFSMAEDSEDTSGRLLQSKYEGSSHKLFLICMCVFFGPLSFGYTIGYSSPAIPDMERRGLINTRVGSWFGSLIAVGAIFGGPLAGWCIERLGRKKTMLLTFVPFGFGWLTLIIFNDVLYLLLARVLTGFASGMVTVACPVYIAEVATKTLRGALGAGIQLSITVGILGAYAAGIYMDYRYMAMLGLGLALLGAAMSIFPPETPRWLMMRDQKLDAIRSLSCLRGAHTDVEDECRDIQDGLQPDEKVTWSEIMKKTEIFRPLQIGIMLMLFQQLSGINAVMFYTVSIFEGAGFKQSQLASVIIGAVQVIGTLVACMLMDRMGRRPLLLFAGATMSATCFTFGLYYHLTIGQGIGGSWGWLAMSSLIIYILGFSLGWGPIPMLVMSELFPTQARGFCCALAVLVNWTAAFGVTLQFVTLQETLGQGGTFWLFSFFCLLGTGFVWKYLPETKGKSLEDIELYFLGRTLIRNI